MWGKGKGKFVWYFGDKTKVPYTRVSAARWDPSTRVMEIYINLYEPVRFDTVKSKNPIGNAFKELFGTKKWLCVVSDSQEGKGHYRTNVAWYTLLDERPEDWKMEAVYQTAVSNAVELMYEGENAKTGDTRVFSACEINEEFKRPDALYKVVKNLGTGKRIYGYYWTEV